MRQLLVFDIDGTLLLSGPVVHESFARSFERAAGVPARLDGMRFAGHTDRGIFAELHGRSGSAVPLDASFEAFRTHYPADLERSYFEAEGPRLLPGVQELLDALAPRADIALSLGTGNIRESAYIKLRRFRLDGLFPVGGFGCATADRAALVQRAIDDSRDHYGAARLAPRPWVIGDTPADVAAAKACGASCVAVGTAFGREELAGADIFVQDLAELIDLAPWG